MKLEGNSINSKPRLHYGELIIVTDEKLRSLEGQHRQNPFILRQDIEDLFTRVYSHNGILLQLSEHDLFRTFMILAIGSLIPFRKGLSQSHPLGFYLAAMRHFDSTFLARGLSAIQDLLLICRFGIYHHIGPSQIIEPNSLA